MKTRLMLSFFVVLILSSFIKEKEKEVEEIPVVKLEPIVVTIPLSESKQKLQNLIDAIGEFESNNRYDVVNRFGFMGRYQFSPRTIKHLGYDVSKEEFLSSPSLQDEIMLAYILDNYNSLHEYIELYADTEHKGMVITPSSILAGAHFAGARGMKRFLNERGDLHGTRDSNGTTLRSYMQRFSDYDIDLEELL